MDSSVLADVTVEKDKSMSAIDLKVFTDGQNSQAVNISVDLSDGSNLPGWMFLDDNVLTGTPTEYGQ